MSLLYRNGNGRNNIALGGSTSTASTYLRRTDTSRNSIRLRNTTFSFFTAYSRTYTSSTTVSIPTGCKHINIFCVGGDGRGADGKQNNGSVGSANTGGGGSDETSGNVGGSGIVLIQFNP